MKKAIVLFVICLVLLTGCNKNTVSASLPAQSNNGGTQAVNISGNSGSTPDSSKSADNKDTEPASLVDDGDKIPASTPDGNKSDDSKEVASGSLAGVDVEIKEKMFIAQTNDIYLNAEDYIGKTIKYEGIFDSYTWEEDLTYYAVIRYGPGCCGTDGNAGFEVVWDNDYPEKDEWVEVIGTLEAYEESGWQYLRLNLSSLTVLSTRGAEYVSQ